MFKTVLCAMLAGLSLLLTAVPARADTSAPKASREVVEKLLVALQKTDAAERLAAVLPLVHKSLLTDDGKDLKAPIKDFSFKKASQSAKLYAVPADIAEVLPGGTAPAGEKGMVERVFVKKKEGMAGRPAPVLVFTPADGGPAKILDFGSL
jgi:hypothetical protein